MVLRWEEVVWTQGTYFLQNAWGAEREEVGHMVWPQCIFIKGREGWRDGWMYSQPLTQHADKNQMVWPDMLESLNENFKL